MPVFDPNSHLLEGLAVVDDGDHVLDIAVRVLPVPQVLLLVQLSFVFVSEDAQPTAHISEENLQVFHMPHRHHS